MHRDPGTFVRSFFILLLPLFIAASIRYYSRQSLRIIDKFDDPETFKPERYLATKYGTKTDEDGADFRDNMHFGSGRVRLSIKLLPKNHHIPTDIAEPSATVSRDRNGVEEPRMSFPSTSLSLVPANSLCVLVE